MPSPDTREVRMVWKGTVSEFLLDTTRYVDLEGAFRSGKTTAACWKVLNSCLANPGIHWLMCRYGDGDTKSKLKPVFEGICIEAGQWPQWHPNEQYYEFSNESRVYCLGLKAQDQMTRYAKLRGLTLAGIYNDQSEELPYDVYLELKGRLSQSSHPHQLILTPNPPDENHWIARTEFPADNHRAGHKYFHVSIFDNEHNLPAETIPGLLEAYPPGHIKHRSAVLGLRGLNVIGEPVYGPLDPTKPETAAFHRELHERPLALDPNLPLYEALDFGKHHPCVVWGQYTPYAELRILGGILGQNMHLEDFAPIVQQYRERWFKGYLELSTCCDPAGSHEGVGLKHNAIEILRDLGFPIRYMDDSNSPAIRYAMIERIAGYMRRRTPKGEAFGINKNPKQWLRINATEAVEHTFMADGFEAGIVWDDHFVSVGSKQIRKVRADGWYEHGHCCCTYLEHNFGGVQPTWEQATRRAVAIRDREQRRVQMDKDPYDAHRAAQRRQIGGRGGY